MDKKPPSGPLPSLHEKEMSPSEEFLHNLGKADDLLVRMLTDENIDPRELQEVWVIRAMLAEQFVDTLATDSARNLWQLRVMEDKALIFERIGNLIRHLEELDSMYTFAFRNHMDLEALSVAEKIDARLPELGQTPRELLLKLRPYIENANRDYLRDLLLEGLDYEDFIGNVYGMILDEGGDPDEVLKELGITDE